MIAPFPDYCHGYKSKKTFNNLLLQNQKANDFETWCEASVTGALQSLYKSDPGMALTYFTARST